TETYEISRVNIKAGQTTIHVRQADGPVNAANRTVRLSTHGLFLCESDASPPSDRHYILKTPCKVGDKWTSLIRLPLSQSEDELTVVCHYRVVSIGQLEVPAGKFETVCIESKVVDGDTVVMQQTVWYATDIGPVKIVEGDRTRILKSFAPGKN